MAVPTAPTATTLATEGLKKAGYASPSSSLITRAEDFYMQEVMNDIHILAKKPKFLHTTAVLVLSEGQSRYSNPTDYSSDMEMTLLFGANSGTAQAGSSSSITVGANDSFTPTDIIGQDILILSGTGKGSMSQVVTYSDTTKVATVSPDFTTAPAAASTYVVVDQQKHLAQTPSFEFDRIVDTENELGEPTNFMPIGDSNDGEFILYPTPYNSGGITYALRLRYYANIMELDLTSTLISTIYSRLRNVFIAGVKYKQLEDDDDNRQQVAKQEYNSILQSVILREQYGMDLNNLVMRVSDY